MFTKQSGRIKNAIMDMGGDNSSATQLVDAVSNCSQALVHSGPVSFDMPPATIAPDPGGGYFPNGGNGLSGGGGPGMTEIFINIPPWQQIPFVPLPYPTFPEWQMIPYLQEPAVTVAGPVQLGPVTAPEITTGAVNTNYMYVRNRTEVEGDINVGGNTTTTGNTTTNNLNVAYNTQIEGDVTTNGTVINKGIVYNNNTHNATTYTSGDATFDGPTNINNQLFIEGNRVIVTKKTFVTNITNDPVSGLTVTFETILLPTLDSTGPDNASDTYTTTVCG